MASSAPNKQQIGRASAVLTTGEVAAASLDLNRAYASVVTAEASFTIGSLTNVILRAYGSVDGTNWFPIYDFSGAGVLWERTWTGSLDGLFTFPSLAGWKFFRMSAQGTGTVTSSLLDLTYRYLRRGSQ